MDEDDPDVLEAFIEYLHTSGTMHIQNWGLSYLEDMDNGQISDGISMVSQRYFPFLANLMVLADKYDQPLLAEAVGTMFKFPAEKEGCESTVLRRGVLTQVFTEVPMDVIKALAILSQLPESSTARWTAQIPLLWELSEDSGNLMTFPRWGLDDKIVAGPRVSPMSETETRESLESLVVGAPSMFATAAGQCQTLYARMVEAEDKHDSAQEQITRLRKDNASAQVEILRLRAYIDSSRRGGGGRRVQGG